MEELAIKNILIEVFENNGIYIDPTEEDDINISNYILDSIQFISTIVAIEEKFDIEIPDDLLIIETFNSFNHLIDIISEISASDTINDELTENN